MICNIWLQTTNITNLLSYEWPFQQDATPYFHDTPFQTKWNGFSTSVVADACRDFAFSTVIFHGQKDSQRDMGIAAFIFPKEYENSFPESLKDKVTKTTRVWASFIALADRYWQMYNGDGNGPTVGQTSRRVCDCILRQAS